jgi:iron-sulfur cluster assembly protein
MTTTQVLTVSDAAAEKAKTVLEQRGRPDGALRLFVAGGGCSGPQYGMALAEAPEHDDTVVTIGGVTFLIDPESLPFVQGAEVDYVEDTMRSGFTIFNPNVQTGGGCACGGGGCGCGGH